MAARIENYALDPSKKRLVGNFPQAFSHIALGNAAFDLEKDAQKRNGRTSAGHT